MPREDQDQQAQEPKNWAEWRQDVHAALEELDKACAHARQVIYRLRPWVRPRKEQTEGSNDVEEQPVPLNQRRPASRER